MSGASFIINTIDATDGETMKVFIWEEPCHVYWGSSILFAVAETVEEARSIALAEKPYAVLREPTEIKDIPCVAWQDWQE